MGVCVCLCLEIKWHDTKTNLVFHGVEFCLCIKPSYIYNVFALISMCGKTCPPAMYGSA